MFRQFFGFSEVPFSPAMSREKLFPSEAMVELLKRFDYIVQNRGFMLLTGDPGTGKSSALRCLFASLNRQIFFPVYLPLSTVAPTDFYKQLNMALSGPRSFSKASLFHSIQGQITSLVSTRNLIPVLCFDEVHLFQDQNFRELQMIGNFHMDSASPAAFILAGQSILQDRLRAHHLTSFFQRISLKFHLNPLSQAETKAYIQHHLKLAGMEGLDSFSEAAYEAVFNLSKGIPRVIGAITTKAFLSCAILKKRNITEDDILSVSQEVL